MLMDCIDSPRDRSQESKSFAGEVVKKTVLKTPKHAFVFPFLKK
jgi:hypothetical protein